MKSDRLDKTLKTTITHNVSNIFTDLQKKLKISDILDTDILIHMAQTNK